MDKLFSSCTGVSVVSKQVSLSGSIVDGRHGMETFSLCGKMFSTASNITPVTAFRIRARKVNPMNEQRPLRPEDY